MVRGWLWSSALRPCCCAQVYFSGSAALNPTPIENRMPWLGPYRTALIEQPPLVSWSRESHKVFPKAFKKSAVAFFICHARLSTTNARSVTPLFTLETLWPRITSKS